MAQYSDYRRDRGPYRGRQDEDDRGFFERAGDEVRSWFGDEEAERRRHMDERHDPDTWHASGRGGWGDRDDRSHRGGRVAAYERDESWRGQDRGNRGSYSPAGNYDRYYSSREDSYGRGSERGSGSAAGYGGGSEDRGSSRYGGPYGGGGGSYRSGGYGGTTAYGSSSSGGANYGTSSYGGSNYGAGSEGRYGGAMGTSYAGTGPKNYQRSDDRLHDDVCQMLTRSHELDASDIEVKVSSGEVTLNGTVPSRWAKRHAEDLVDDCSGVKHVQNNLRIEERSEIGGSTASSSAGAASRTSL